MVCKVCKLDKLRDKGKQAPNGKGYYYHDSYGRYWNGHTCPDCKKTKHKVIQKRYLNKSRPCVTFGCLNNRPPNRMFFCLQCHGRDRDVEDILYGYMRTE